MNEYSLVNNQNLQIVLSSLFSDLLVLLSSTSSWKKLLDIWYKSRSKIPFCVGTRQNRHLTAFPSEIFLDGKMVVQLRLNNDDSNENGKETALV